MTAQNRQRIKDRCCPEPNTGCWLWMGAVDRSGYGRFNLASGTRKAHRLSYESFVGPITGGLFVLHRCDTPLCVNPEHLFLGTTADNMKDMIAKGRSPAGERSGRAKLTAAQVAEIRASTLRHSELALVYPVSAATICDIRRGQRWSAPSPGAGDQT